jgi:hypothetical protein
VRLGEKSVDLLGQGVFAEYGIAQDEEQDDGV